MSSCRGVSWTVHSASQASVNRVNQRAPARNDAAAVDPEGVPAGAVLPATGGVVGSPAGEWWGTADSFVENAAEWRRRVPAG